MTTKNGLVFVEIIDTDFYEDNQVVILDGFAITTRNHAQMYYPSEDWRRTDIREISRWYGEFYPYEVQRVRELYFDGNSKRLFLQALIITLIIVWLIVNWLLS